MQEKILRVSNLSKSYVLGGGASVGGFRYKRLTEELAGAVKSMWRGKKARSEAAVEKDRLFWALSDVSFDVAPGEVVGIVGRNGAGKSTLLKILSRITEPSAGKIEIDARIASLLEVGTGFHPELSGRENIFLNGALLGMSRSEVLSKFDDIVAFAEVEAFLDTPVKRYSSGMYVRLAFAVAAFLEPEILIVDEVLAVGDAEFQRKCIGRMREVATKSGRTVLFVSHNMGAVKELCNRAIVLQKGRVAMDSADVAGAIQFYLGAVRADRVLEVSYDSAPAANAQILSARLCRDEKAEFDDPQLGEELAIEVGYELRQSLRGFNVSIFIMREGTVLLNTFDTDTDPALREERPVGRYLARAKIPRNLLKAGIYEVGVDIGITSVGTIEEKAAALSFVIDELSEDTTHRGYALKRKGIVRGPILWETTRL